MGYMRDVEGVRLDSISVPAVSAKVPNPSADATGAADKTAIQAALDAGAGGVVAFPVGSKNYVVNGSLVVPSATTVLFNGAMVKAAAGTNAAVFTNAGYLTGGATGIRLIGPGGADANGAQQTAEVNAFDFNQLTHSVFDGIEGMGGRRVNGYPTGTNGEGIALRNSTYCDIVNGHFHDNAYDGIKLRTSSYCRVAGNTCKDNGRSGIQISFNSQTSPTAFSATPFNVGEGVEASGSNYNVISGNKLFHTTGTPHGSAPTTSGVYIHTGVGNVVSGNSIHGFRQGVAVYGGASRNQVTGNELALRFVDKGAFDVETNGAGTCSYNQFADNIVTWLSGASSPRSAKVAEGSFNRFIANRYFLGGATGSIFPDCFAPAASTQFLLESGYLPGSVNNTGSNTAIAGMSGNKLITVGGLGLGNSVAATTPGTVTRKLEVFDSSGNSLGFVPIYGAIT